MDGALSVRGDVVAKHDAGRGRRLTCREKEGIEAFVIRHQSRIATRLGPVHARLPGQPGVRMARNGRSLQNIVEHQGVTPVANNPSATASAPGWHSTTRPARAMSPNEKAPR